MEFMSIACEFLDIFPIDLPRLPPAREIDFSIKVESGIKPISISPYRMAPAELKELSSQLQSLLDLRSSDRVFLPRELLPYS